MGIYDRDYMRQAEREPADTPGMTARKGIILAVCIVVGLLFISSVIRRNAAAKEREVRQQRIEEEQLLRQLQWAARVIKATPRLESQVKSDPPPLPPLPGCVS